MLVTNSKCKDFKPIQESNYMLFEPLFFNSLHLFEIFNIEAMITCYIGLFSIFIYLELIENSLLKTSSLNLK